MRTLHAVDEATYAKLGEAYLICAEYPEVFEGVTMEKFCSMFVDVIPDGESELTARAKAHAVEMYKLLNKVFIRVEFTGLDGELKSEIDACLSRIEEVSSAGEEGLCDE